MTNYQRLLEFHTAVNGSAPEAPNCPDAKTLELRETLLCEEFEESMAALQRVKEARAQGEPPDLAPLANELVDLLYVTYGTLVDFGIDADAVFQEVHRANMTKLSGPKREDGKQLKPEGWQKADVRGVLEHQHQAKPFS